MSTRISKFIALSREKQTLLCTSVVLLLASRALLPVARLDRTHYLIHWLVWVFPPYTKIDDPGKIPWAVTVVDTTLPFETTCLMQAIVGERLLAAHDYEAQIQLGIDSSQEFEAHAWVEREGEIVLGEVDDHARFQPLAGYDAS